MGGKGSGRARSFDYAEVRRLRWVVGLPAWYIAQQLGIDVTSVYRALSAQRRKREVEYHRKRRAAKDTSV